MPASLHVSRRGRRLLVLIGSALLVAAIVVTGIGADPRSPEPRAPVPHGPGDEPIEVGVAVTGTRTAVLARPEPDAEPVSELRGGIPVPVSGREGDFYAVLTPCEIDGWIPAEHVDTYPPAPDAAPGELAEATVVIDPGHGGIDLGAVGPNGLTEEEVNREIVSRLVEMLEGAGALRRVARGVVPDAELEPPRVILTRRGDYYAGVRFRAEIADRANAHAFVSLHNNSSPDLQASEGPGTEAYFQRRSEDSRRLAGLLHEEVVRVVEHHDVPWVANRDAGAKYRVGDDGEDFYGVLRRPEVPAVLAEVLFISNAPEETLLGVEGVQEAIAGAHARALVRYFLTEDPGSGFVDPLRRPDPPGGGSGVPSSCVDPG